MLKSCYKNDQKIEAGLDEVGRGSLWGSLVTAAVIWLPEDEWSPDIRELSSQIKDSKKLSEKKRNQLSEKIKDAAIDFGIGEVSAAELDSNGMTWANQTAFYRAVQALSVPPDRLLVDGILPLRTEHCGEAEQITIIEGDAHYISIAAASILAKVHRDTHIVEWCASNSQIASDYGLLSSTGYGTLAHRTAIKEKGPLQDHRRLFLRKLLGYDIYVHARETVKGQNCLIQDEEDN